MNINFSSLFSVWKKLLLAFLFFSFCRIIFVVFNASQFDEIHLSLFFYGLRFDWVSLSYLMGPLVVVELIPIPIKHKKWFQILLKWLFFFPLIIGIIFNMLDVSYFQYTLKRTTFDFFNMVATGDDFWNLLPNYIIDFWQSYLVLAVLVWLLFFLYKKTIKFPLSKKSITYNYLSQSIIWVLSVGFLVVGMRGGLQYKPINIVNAGQYTQNTPIVLNTPFTIFKTIFITGIQEVSYFEDQELEKIYTPIQKINSNLIFKKQNVVLIILESFSKEYIGYLNNHKGYTPFLDSLMKHSLVFTNAFANGQRSIESLPGILAGLPQLMGTPYSVSPYAGNSLDALPEVLKQNGYNTSFYHGGANGTMGFNGFVGAMGVENYFGMNEYPNKTSDYDGNWGIFDEPYLQYFANELSRKKEPFFSAVFTLSSHHPYTIPDKYIGKFPKGNLPIHETIGYTDYSLKKFFNTAKKQSWFNHTIFVITADHASQSEKAFYKTKLNRFAIPALIYLPNNELVGEVNDFFQQIDITPSLLHLLGINTKIISFGNNAFENQEKYAVNYISGNYQIAMKDYFLMFDGKETIGFYYLKNDSLLNHNLMNKMNNNQTIIKSNLKNKLKAIIQQYNSRVIKNELSTNKN